jgi:hypothetical protein
MIKWPRRGLLIYWRRGRDGRFAAPKAAAPLLGSNRALILNHTRRENKKAPRGGFFIFWRGGESRADEAPSTPGPLFQFYQNQFPRGIGNILGQMLATRNEQGIARIG